VKLESNKVTGEELGSKGGLEKTRKILSQIGAKVKQNSIAANTNRIL
jgi:hypothetical protein